MARGASVVVAVWLLSSCINFAPLVGGNIGLGATFDTGLIAFADVTGDGRADALVVGSDGRLRTMLRCAGDTCLTPGTSVILPSSVQDLATGDFNNDGADDLVVAGSELRVFFGGVTGFHRPAGLVSRDSVTVAALAWRWVIIGDLNGDTHLDIGAASATSYVIYPGDGFGGFGSPMTAYTTPPLPSFISDLAVGDFDGDGAAEGLVAVVGLLNGSIHHGYLSLAVDIPTVSYEAPGWDDGIFGVGDLDGDGLDDFVRTVPSTDSIRLLRSTGTNFTGFGGGGAITSVDAPSTPHTLRLEDVDVDGQVDLLVGRAGGLSWWHGVGDGTFETFPNGQSRVDRAVPDAKALELAHDDGVALPNVVVSQGQPDGRIAFLLNRSMN